MEHSKCKHSLATVAPNSENIPKLENIASHCNLKRVDGLKPDPKKPMKMARATEKILITGVGARKCQKLVLVIRDPLSYCNGYGGADNCYRDVALTGNVG